VTVAGQRSAARGPLQRGQVRTVLAGDEQVAVGLLEPRVTHGGERGGVRVRDHCAVDEDPGYGVLPIPRGHVHATVSLGACPSSSAWFCDTSMLPAARSSADPATMSRATTSANDCGLTSAKPLPAAVDRPDPVAHPGDRLDSGSALDPVGVRRGHWGRGPASPGQGEGKQDVLSRGERRHQVEGLEHEPDPVPAHPRELLVLSRDRSVPGMVTVPLSAVSSAAAQCMSVDFPEPDGPITAVNAPAAMSTVTSSRAVTPAGPVP
jgi:hypothetical protein